MSSIPLIKNGLVVNVVELGDDTPAVTIAQLERLMDEEDDAYLVALGRWMKDLRKPAGERVIKDKPAVRRGQRWTIPEGYTVGPEGGKIGDTWDGEKYTSPSEPTPEPVEPRPELTAEQKLKQFGLTVDDLRQLLGE